MPGKMNRAFLGTLSISIADVGCPRTDDISVAPQVEVRASRGASRSVGTSVVAVWQAASASAGNIRAYLMAPDINCAAPFEKGPEITMIETLSRMTQCGGK